MYKENLVAHLTTAQQLVNKQEFEKATTIYTGILAEIPGQPDSYYGLYKIEMLKADKQKAKAYFKECLLKLSISIDYDMIHKKIFDIWIQEYRKIFGEDIFILLSDEENSVSVNLVKRFIQQKRYKNALEIIKKSKLNKELLVFWFKLDSDLGLEKEAVLLAYTILYKVEDIKLWHAILNLFVQNGLLYDAIKVALKIIEKDNNNYEAHYYVAVLGVHIEHNYDAVISHLKKSLEIKPDYNKSIELFITTYLKVNHTEEAKKVFDKYVVKKEQFAYFIECFFIFDIKGDYLSLKDEIFKLNNIFKIAEFYKLCLYTGNINIAEECVLYYKDLAVLETVTPKIKDKKLKLKSKQFENVIAFHTIGRGGSFFFHSLIDGHNEIATYPGVYMNGYFDPGTFGMLKSVNLAEHIKKFMNTFEAMFDASDQKRVPGDPMGGNINIGETSGLTTLGENRDIVFKIDKKRFYDLMLKYLGSYKYITQKEFFKVVHIVIEEMRGDDIGKKKVIFYHIHNPSSMGHFRYANLFSNAKDLMMIRNWLQSLESWLYVDVAEIRNIKAQVDASSYQIRLNTFLDTYGKVQGKLNTRLFHLRTIFYSSKNMAAVKLEDVKNTPEATMRAVSKWMGIEYDESLLKAEFMGEKFHSNKSKLNPTISEFDKKAIKRKVGVLFSHSDAVLLNTVLRPWNETFEYEEGEFKYVSIEEALAMNENIMDWERKLIDFFEISEEDALKSIKYRKQKLALALNTQEQVYEELKKVKLIKPEGGEIE